VVDEISAEIPDIKGWSLFNETETFLGFEHQNAGHERSHLTVTQDQGKFTFSDEGSEEAWHVIFYGFTKSGNDAQDTKFCPPETFEEVEDALHAAKQWMKENHPGDL